MSAKHKWACDDGPLFAVVTADGEIWAVFADKNDADDFAKGGTFSESDNPQVRPADVDFVAIKPSGEETP